MKRVWQGNEWSLVALLSLMICASTALAVRDDYSIEFGLNEEVVQASGTGYNNGTWYYYPHSGEYIQWFYNDPFDPLRKSNIELWMFIASVQSDQFYHVNIKFGWTKPAWNLDHPNDPRPPIHLNSSAQQSLYLHTEVIKSMDKSKNWMLPEGGSIEPHANYTVEDYNPQWLYVSAKGGNARVYRFVNHECVAGGGGSGGGGAEPFGACCNQQTGTCYQAKQVNCPSNHHWMGAGSDCASCQAATAIWDFGDAPSLFPVLLADNGARHLVQSGVYLGSGVTVEPDGMPGETATGDIDDGVLFSSQLMPGSASIVRMHASTYGAISAWIDYNLDGDWNDLGEQIFTDEPLEPGPNSRTVLVPATALIGPSYARFRFSTTGGLSYNGQAPNGEVEDYLVNLGTSNFPPLPGPGSTFAPPSEQYYSKWFQAAEETPSTQIAGWPESSLFHAGPIVADDWESDGANPVVGIRWWGSFYAWASVVPPPLLPDSFHIAIWSDGVDGESPGTLVWEKTCEDWSWSYAGLIQDPRALASGQAAFEFAHFFSQDEWFQPPVEEEVRYWLSVSARYDTGQPNYSWGWMTRRSNYQEAAIGINEIQGARAGPWPPSLGSSFEGGTPITHPLNTPWDMSFDLISRRSAAGPVDMLSAADVNGDGVVDIQDISALMRSWLDD